MTILPRPDCVALAPVLGVAAAVLGGCAATPLPDQAGLPAEARTLEAVLDRGCFAYMLDGKSEPEAMHGLGLVHHGPALSLFDPPGPPTWTGFRAGLSDVVVGASSCSVNMKARDAAAYRAAVQVVLRRRFGSALDEDRPSAYRQILPGQVTGCQSGVLYTYYATRRIFSVDLTRSDCPVHPIGRP